MFREKGYVYILDKNNKPEFVLKKLDDEMELTDDEKIDVACKRIMKRYHKAFEELAK